MQDISVDWWLPDVGDRRRDDEKMGSIEEVFECPSSTSLNFVPFKMESLAGKGE